MARIKKTTKNRHHLHRYLLLILLFLPQNLLAMPPLKVGVYPNLPITGYTQATSPQGIFPEILQYIADEEGWSLTYVPGTWSQCLERLERGEIDLIPAIAATSDRLPLFRFCQETVLTAWGQIYISPGSKIHSILDLDGKSVGIMRKSVFFTNEHGLRELCRKFNLNVHFIEFETYPEVFQALQQGVVDAGMVNRFYGNLHENSYKVAKSPILISPIEIRFAASQTAPPNLENIIDAHLRTLKADQSSAYHQILDKWLHSGVSKLAPNWLWPSLLIMGISLLLLSGVNMLLRHQVRRKTSQLVDKNRQLTDEVNDRRQAEKALSDQFLQITTIFDALDAIVYVADMETYELLYVNAAVEKYFGKDCIGAKCFEKLQKNLNDPCEFCTNEKLVIDGIIQPPCVWEFQNTVTKTWYQCIDRAIRWTDGRLVRLEIAIDVSKRKQNEDSLAEERAFLQTIINGVTDPVMVIGLDYRILLMNRAAAAATIRQPDGSACLYCHQVSHRSEHPCRGLDHPCPLEEVRKTGTTVNVVHQHLTDNEERHIFELTASPLWNKDGSLRGIIEVSRDITDILSVKAKLTENERQMNYLAYHDYLTNLPNRLLFEDRLEHALAKARRSNNLLALLFLDLDRFKKINDSLGHEIGDQVLIEAAGRLKGCVRESDTVARMGGDEFVIILEQIPDSNYASLVANKLLGQMMREFQVDQHALHLTTSIGISIFPHDGENTEALLRAADVAMYRAKEGGKNSYQYFTPDMKDRARHLLELENDLHTAIRENQFLLHYQPQFDLTSKTLLSLEALVRWQHPTHGLIAPGEFIPLAEETGQIIELGKWVLRAACQQGKAWQAAGCAPFGLAINMSVRQFQQADLLAVVDQALAESGWPAELLELEVTESILIDEVERVSYIIRELKNRGIRVAIDDFGSGYCSLNYLKRFPLDKLKIDRQFVSDIMHSDKDAAIATAIIQLARELKLEVVAEGIETEEQLSILKALHCPQGQGFLLGRPMPAEDIAAFLPRPPQ